MIGRKPKRPFVMVYNDEIITFGADAAVLLAELRFLSNRRKKDNHGYFTIENTYLCNLFNMNKRKLIYERNKLIKAGKLEYIAGSNQNIKSRYKIVL